MYLDHFFSDLNPENKHDKYHIRMVWIRSYSCTYSPLIQRARVWRTLKKILMFTGSEIIVERSLWNIKGTWKAGLCMIKIVVNGFNFFFYNRLFFFKFVLYLGKENKNVSLRKNCTHCNLDITLIGCSYLTTC